MLPQQSHRETNNKPMRKNSTTTTGMRLKQLMRAMLLGALAVLSLEMNAQQDIQFTHYMFNTVYYNPGSAGRHMGPHMTLIHRSQWLGYSPTDGSSGGAPTTQLFTFSSMLPNPKWGGVGLHVAHDKLGPQTNIEVNAAYSYWIKLANDKRLGIGFRLGAYNNAIDASRLVYNQDNGLDPTVEQNDLKVTRFDRGLGLWYQSTTWFGGVGMNHLTKRPDVSALGDGSTTLENHMFILAGYNYQLSNPDWVITPSTLIKTDFYFKGLSFDVTGLATYQNRYWGGVAYRFGESISGLVGMAFTKNNALKLGYAFDYTAFGTTAKKPTSHEIMLAYTFPELKIKPKPIIKDIRFNHF